MTKNGLQRARYLDVEEARRRAEESGYVVFVLPSEGVHDRRSFFDAIRATLPLDPPVHGDGWDALSDSLWEGLLAHPARRIAILWPNTAALARAAPADFERALDVFADVASLLADTRATCDRAKEAAFVIDDSNVPGHPGGLKRLIERQLTRLDPWCVFDDAAALERRKGLESRYPGRALVPFARREDNDDVACFDLETPGVVVVIHDFAADAWERRRAYADFYAWLRQAVEDMIELDRLEDDSGVETP